MSVMMGSGKREAVVSQPQPQPQPQPPPPPPHRDGGAEDEDAAKSWNKLYVCFYYNVGSLIYSVYEIAVPNPLPCFSSPIKLERNPKPIPLPNSKSNPIFQLKRGEYPRRMCCVELNSKLYFIGGEFHDGVLDLPYVDEDFKIKYKSVTPTRDRYPSDVYRFDPTTTTITTAVEKMHTGKNLPLAFVVDEKIYVLGSTYFFAPFEYRHAIRKDIEKLSLFECYDPQLDKWTLLPNPTLPCHQETKWEAHAVLGEGKGKKVLFVDLHDQLYSFDLHKREWIQYLSPPPYLHEFCGRSEFVDGTLYGLNQDFMVAAIKFPLAEPEEVQNSKHPLYLPSKEVGMNLFYFPRQVAATARLLHLGNRVFLYALSGMHPDPKFDDFNRDFEENKRVISILIFQALPLPDTHIQEGFFPAKLLYSVHYNINTTFPNQGGILGCFPLGPGFVFGDGSHPTHAEHRKAPVSDFPSDPLFVPQSVPNVLQPWTKDAMTLALQSKEAMTTQSLPPISVEAEGHKDVENIVVATTSVEAARVDTGVDDYCVDTEDDFIRTTGSRLVCKRKRIDHPHGPG
ncbi:uncharacterized protein LOC115972140 isoform X1 [Quercus lobata]|uniref:uncharacterized protein LOC115972140 isoform X1 n=1 Tax=Quercus lobata TaxID=97700 RepID=UPI001248A96D|nr:uncharacterized protein LOC115972140 isoform X1 [Quercus lobata]